MTSLSAFLSGTPLPAHQLEEVATHLRAALRTCEAMGDRFYLATAELRAQLAQAEALIRMSGAQQMQLRLVA